jgi:DNA helicase IV
VATHPELEAEQAHVDRAYERLDQLRSDTEELLRSVLDQGRGGTHQFREERDVIVRTSLARLDQLDIGEQALCFGRIDRRPVGEAANGHGGERTGGGATGPESFHIGRLGISGDDLEPLVVDWRAPVAEPFYRATGREPMGLVLRRHLAVQGRRIVGIEDERFGADDAAAANGTGPAGHGGAEVDSEMELGGPGALLAALEGARTGVMRDIVATIQREQDAIIRSPLPGVMVVQGGPGTGKTAVALHRAAYLLYTHRFPLERQGVLVIGPNPLFLRYIEHVLPSLGESGVTLSTVGGLVHGVQVRGEDGPVVARLKGDARMGTLVTRAVRGRQRPLRRDAEVPFGAAVLRLSAEASAAIVTAARRRPGTHNTRRRFVEQLVIRRLADEYERTLAVHGITPGGPGPDDADEFLRASEGPAVPDAGFREATLPAELPRPDEDGPDGGFHDGGFHDGGFHDGASREEAFHQPSFPGPAFSDQNGSHQNGSDQIDSDQIGSDPAGSDPIGFDPTGPDRSGSDPAGHDPAGSGRVGPDTGVTGNGRRADQDDDEPAFDVAEFSRQMRRMPEVADALDRMWPRLSAEELLHDLFGSKPLLALAGKGVLTSAELARLYRPRAASLGEIPWSFADLALIDEARVLLGPRRGRPGGPDHDDGPRTYGHIVVDEAQDLSPMQLRSVARRSLSGSLTVVGDIGQATGPWAPAGWEDVTAHLPGQRPAQMVELTVSYRTPAEVVEVAGRVLAAAAPGLIPPTPVRRTGVAPRFEEVAAGALADRVAVLATEVCREVAPGTAAVLAPASLVAELSVALDAAGVEASDPRRDGLGAPLSLLPVDLANGLEFDAVVVVEPVAVAEESPQGLRALYVALTRPTRRLVVAHSRPLPPALRP